MERIQKLLQYLAAQPTDAFLLHALALEYEKMGHHAEAMDIFKKQLAANPDYVGSYYHAGRVYAAAGDLAGAIATYEKGMEVAKAAGDQHALNELRMVLDEILEQ